MQVAPPATWPGVVQQLRDQLAVLAELRRQGLLDPHWREVVRSALFLCPFLVTDLLAAHRTPQVRMLGLANAVMMGSEPVTGDDPVTRMFDRIEGALG